MESIRVLVVDDDREFAALTREYLEREDERFEVSVVDSAAAGLETLASDTVDCVVSDYEMSPLDGIEFLERVRAEYPALPFVLFTGRGSEDVASDAIAAGVTDYLHKASGTDQYAVLANRVANAVGRYRAERGLRTERDRFRALFANSPDPMYEVGLTGGDPVIREVNPAFESVFGYEADELVGRTVAETIVPPEKRDQHDEIRRLVSEGETVDREVDRETASGTRTFRLRVIPFADDGEVQTVYGWYTDVTDRRERERRLTAERDRVQALFENTDEAIAYTEFEDDVPVIRAVNPAFETIFGHDESAVVGRPIDDVVVPEGEGALAEEINDRLRQGERVEYEVRRRTADGVEDFVHRSVPIEGDPPVERAYAIYRPITARKERERALEEEREKYQTLFEKSNDGIVVIQDDAFVTVNGQFADLVGVDAPAALEGEPYIDFVAPEYSQAIRDRYEARMAGESPPKRYDIAVVTTDGERIPVELNMSVITYGGAPADMAIVRDISERKQREQALSDLHRAASELETAGDREAVYETLVDAAEEILDFALVAVDVREGDVLVQRAWTLDNPSEGYYSETPIEEDTLATRAYRRGETIVADDLREYDIVPADAEYRSALTVPIGEEGTFQTVSRQVGAFDDTDRELAELLVGHAQAALERLDNARSLREQRERLRRENERLEAFASIVSHDLRNPLNVATGRIDFAREECESDQLATAADALDRMGDIIEDVLTWAREGQHVDEEELAPVTLSAIARTCWSTVETPAAHVEVAEDATIRADERRLQHVFENFYRNAVDHAATDGDVTVTVGATEDGFYVEDDGPGIPEADREAVFDYGYTGAGTGTGFGLAIVKDVVAAHGWAIRTTESATGGARFEISGVEFVD